MEIKVGKECLVVTTGNAARYGTKTYKATISKVGRKWFRVNTPNIYIGENNQFSIEPNRKGTHLCDGRGFMSDFYVVESEEILQEIEDRPVLVKQLTAKVEQLSYKDLLKIRSLLEEISNGN